MAKAKAQSASTFFGVLTPNPPITREKAILQSFTDPSAVPPGVLIDWILKNAREIEKAGMEVYGRRDEATDADPPERLAAESLLESARDFVRMADLAFQILSKEQNGAMEALLIGLRMGVAYEKLASVSDGRYKRVWTANHGITKAVAKRPKKDSLRDETLSAIEDMKRKHPDRANDSDFIKQKVAKTLGVSKRTVNNRIRPSVK